MLQQHKGGERSGLTSSDDLLLEAWAQGNPEAFATLVRRHTGALLGAIRRFVGVELAEEVVQDTWLVVVAKVGSFEHRGEFPAWLLAIGRNLAKRRERRESREHGFRTDAATLQLSKMRQEDWVGNAASVAPDPCQQALARERLARARLALCRLSARDRGLVHQGIMDADPDRRCGSSGATRIARLRARRRLLRELNDPAAASRDQ